MKTILSSDNYQVTVDSLGAELKSFQNPNHKEFIWNSDPAYWGRSSPLLFPTIGNVRDNKTIIDGREYPMSKHGFCRDSDFKLLGKGVDYATFVLSTSQETLKFYPYQFELQLTYKLQGNTLHMSYQVSNLDNREIYYHIGAHPGFLCPLEAGESLSDYILEFEKEEHLEATVYDLDKLCFSSRTKLYEEKGRTLQLSPELFNEDAIYFPHTNSHAVNLINPVSGKGIHMSYPGFKSIAFWTPIGGKAPFLCLEPWNGAAIYEDEDDIFRHKRDIEVLPAGEKASYQLEISLIGY